MVLTLKPTSIVLSRSPGQHEAARPVHHRHQVEPTAHRDVGDVRAPQLAGPDDVQAAQQVRIDSVARLRPRRVRGRGRLLASPPQPSGSAPCPVPPRGLPDADGAACGACRSRELELRRVSPASHSRSPVRGNSLRILSKSARPLLRIRRRSVRRRQIQRRVAVEEPDRLKHEAAGLDGHHGPVLGPRQVGRTDGMPEHHIRIFDVAVVGGPGGQAVTAGIQVGMVAGGT